MNKLGTKVAEKRKSLGMTQIEFAEKMHVTRQTISRWEADIDLYGTPCRIMDFEGNWMRVAADTKKEASRPARCFLFLEIF